MASSPDPTTKAKTELKDVKYDTRYYFQEDYMAIFLVEGCLFKVHRYFLVGGSEVFRDMFASPAEGSGPEGKNDEQPILLPDVTQREFQALLDYFYLPPHAHGWLDISNTKNHWQTYADLLSISHRFLFDKVFQFAVEKLGPMINSIPAAQRFALGQKYGLKDWMFSAYETLLDRETTPTAQELEILGFDKAARLMQAKNAMHQRHLQDIKANCRCTQKDEGKTSDLTSTLFHRSNPVLPFIVHTVPQRTERAVVAPPLPPPLPPVIRPVAKSFVQEFFG